jgi:translation elongation factor EF-Tu-like GTPase
MISLRPTADGGRRSPISLTGAYRPHLMVDSGDGTYLGVIIRGNQTATLRPGDAAEVLLDLPYDIDYSALNPGATFDILEGHHVIGTGQIQDAE